MTQLMLFDAPMPTSLPATATTPSDRRLPRASATRTMPASAYTAPASDEPQRMGNLAYLVIARYDMVVRRREAQRRAAQRQADAVRLQSQTA